jgi:hypothetical protein
MAIVRIIGGKPMKARSTVNALLAVTGQLLAAKKAARNRRVVSRATVSGARVAKLVPESRPLLMRLTAQLAS